MTIFDTKLLAVLLPFLALSTTVEARTVLGAKTRCFQIGSQVPGGWHEILEIQPQRALSDRNGALIGVTGLVHGTRAVEPPISYYNQLTGSASYIPPGNQVVNDVVQIALVGTSYGTTTGTTAGVYGLYAYDFSLRLKPEKKGRIPGGQLTGVKRFQPIGDGHDGEPATSTPVDQPVTEVSCAGF